MLRISWARTATERLIWGAQEVGISRTLAGLLRLARLAIRRPHKTEIVTATDGLKIAFEYPAQLMPLLVVFQELLDPEIVLLPRLLGPGRIALDIGASIGTWTLYAAKTGAVVHACEPDSRNFATLKQNVQSNHLEANVRTHDCALGAGAGWSTVSDQVRRYELNFRLAADSNHNGGTRICTLDDFIHSIGVAHIDILKVNTAGCEADVLAGAIELFRHQRVGIAMFLDGVAVRPQLDVLAQFSYELGFYDKRADRFVPADSSARLDALRPAPMNRYLLVKHSSVNLRS